MFLISIFVVLLVIGIVLLACFCFNDSIEIESQKNDAINVSDDVALNSTPIIIDNLVVGATYNSRWVSANKYYLKSNNKNDCEIDVYNDDVKAGTYKIKEFLTDENTVFVNTSYPNYVDEYFAIAKDSNYALVSQFGQTQVEQKDYEYVKKALGLYRLYNTTMNIKNVYNGYINANTPVRILTVTSNGKGMFGGVYSSIILAFPNENKAKILQYSYTKDLENSDDFPIYSVEFLADLNGDGKGEIITREVTEFNVTYNVFEYENDNCFKVLSETMKGNK